MKNAFGFHLWEVFVTYHEPDVLEVTFLQNNTWLDSKLELLYEDSFTHFPLMVNSSTSGRYGPLELFFNHLFQQIYAK